MTCNKPRNQVPKLVHSTEHFRIVDTKRIKKDNHKSHLYFKRNTLGLSRTKTGKIITRSDRSGQLIYYNIVVVMSAQVMVMVVGARLLSVAVMVFMRQPPTCTGWHRTLSRAHVAAQLMALEKNSEPSLPCHWTNNASTLSSILSSLPKIIWLRKNAWSWVKLLVTASFDDVT